MYTTGVTAANEHEQQRKRDEVIRQRQERERNNVERKVKAQEQNNSPLMSKKKRSHGADLG